MDRYGGDPRGRGGGGNRRRDVKSRTMNRFTVYDEDVGSQYDYDDDEPPLPISTRGSIVGSRQLRIIGRHLQPQQQARRDHQLQRTTGGVHIRKEMIHHFVVKQGIRAGKERIMKLLGDAVDNFRPIAPKINQTDIEFYITDEEVAEGVRAMNRRIADKKSPGQKFVIYGKRVVAPWEPLKNDVKQLIEGVVKLRYSAQSNALDLGDFGNDKKFIDAGVNCRLITNNVLVYVADVIARFFGTLQGLSLKGNCLRQLDFVSTLIYSAPGVTELDLSSNALMRIDELDRIRGWRIEKLHLENNELVARYPDASSYTSAVHTIFSRVNYLDGVFVNRDPFKIDINDDEDGGTGILPTYRAGYSPNGGLRNLVENFIVEYLSFYDGPNGEETRKRLINAYEENAVFTHTIVNVHDPSSKQFIPRGDVKAFEQYIRSSHNIMQEDKWAKYRDKIIYKGSMDIAVALSKLPLSTHVKDSFVLEFSLVTPTMVNFTLQGILRDGSDAFTKDGACKFFIRTFTVVPKSETTISIVSDMLTLFQLGVDRLERYNKLLKKAATANQEAACIDQMQQMPTISQQQSQMMVSQGMLQQQMAANSQLQQATSSSMATSAAPAPSSYDVNDPEIQRAMIDQFSQISGMKPEWSQKCLLDMNWDFEAAGRVFNEMRSAIPPDAFR